MKKKKKKKQNEENEKKIKKTESNFLKPAIIPTTFHVNCKLLAQQATYLSHPHRRLLSPVSFGFSLGLSLFFFSTSSRIMTTMN